MDQAKSSGKPTVASMSLGTLSSFALPEAQDIDTHIAGGSATQALDDAVSKAIEAGITFAIAAGNENSDAGETSPARVKAAITVGASDISNAKADFSVCPASFFHPHSSS